jgi:hypothetical protein
VGAEGRVAPGSPTACTSGRGVEDYPGTDDLVAFFDCLHDMGTRWAPRASARLARGDVAWMIVEPFAHDDLGRT